MGVQVLPSARDVRLWQLARLRELLVHARKNSPFYAGRLAGVDADSIRSLRDLARIPMTRPEHLRDNPDALLCVSRDEIARVVTLNSSGTTGMPKRIFNTEGDQERIRDFFSHGMANMLRPGETALLLLPADRPGGVGRLLMDSLERMGARGVAHGSADNGAEAVDHLLASDAQCVVGSPAQVNALASVWERRGLPPGHVHSVLLCWDAIPDAVVGHVTRALGCKVFRHWGMMETGLGGAVECAPGSGMHIREADVLLEIIDPVSGELLPDGEAGEIVTTMLFRWGMPLVRYRTGDMGRILPGICACGSPLRRLDSQVRRMAEGVETGYGRLTLAQLDEVLYAIPELIDFHAAWHPGESLLEVTAFGHSSRLGNLVRNELEALTNLGPDANVSVEVRHEDGPAVPGLAKRRIRIGR